MDARGAEAELKAMLREASVDLDHPDPVATWTVFKGFAAIRVDDLAVKEDGLLFVWGVYAWGDGRGERFKLELPPPVLALRGRRVRPHEQLECRFYLQPTPELRALGSGASDWWFRSEARNLDDWIARVEALAAFRVPFATGASFAAKIGQREV